RPKPKMLRNANLFWMFFKKIMHSLDVIVIAGAGHSRDVYEPPKTPFQKLRRYVM
ncbi:hypothetical protein ACJX0J_017860, partial [Zea mays]